MDDDTRWMKNRHWTYVEKDVYPEAWESDQGDLLYIKDHRYGGQTELTDFTESRYTLELDRWYRPSEEPFVLGTFEDEWEAGARIRNLTYPD